MGANQMPSDDGDPGPFGNPAPSTAVAPLKPGTATIMRAGETASTAVAAQAKASVEARYLMALQRPRNWMDVANRLNSACARPGVAEDAEWTIKRGGKNISGPTIRFAEEALRAATNILSEIMIVFDDDEKRIVRITMTDLESNWSIPRDIMLYKTVERRHPSDKDRVVGQRVNSQGDAVYLVAATEDDLLFKQNALCSKVMRTDGLRLIPTDIKEDALAIAAATRRKGDSADPAAAAKKIATKFFGVGVQASQLEKLIAKPLTAVTDVDLDLLRRVYSAIKEGESTWDEIQESIGSGEPIVASGKSGTAGLKDKLAQKAAPAADTRTQEEKDLEEDQRIVAEEEKKGKGAR